MLGWSQGQLAEAAQVAKKTIADFERESAKPRPRTIAAFQRALEAAGIEFMNSDAPGLRLRKEPA